MDQSDLKFSIDTAFYKRVSTGEKVNGRGFREYQPTQQNDAATTPLRRLWCATIAPHCNATGGARDWGVGKITGNGVPYPLFVSLLTYRTILTSPSNWHLVSSFSMIDCTRDDFPPPDPAPIRGRATDA
jgi:hypothetical protein